MAEKRPMIFLITDFGLCDPYVGQMKAALLTHAPEAKIIDLTHQVIPFQVRQAGYLLASSLPFLPKASVSLAVVDPGVGTSRGIVALEIDERWVVAPDNGLASLAISRADSVRAHRLTWPSNSAISATFHGRDLFAPLAANLALKGHPGLLGETCETEALIRLPDSKSGDLHVLHIDRFGNVITSLTRTSAKARGVEPGGKLALQFGGREYLIPWVHTYGELKLGQLGLLEGSQGQLELAVNQGSAAAALGIEVGNGFHLGPV